MAFYNWKSKLLAMNVKVKSLNKNYELLHCVAK